MGQLRPSCGSVEAFVWVSATAVNIDSASISYG